jgi:hypothetical protein
MANVATWPRDSTGLNTIRFLVPLALLLAFAHPATLQDARIW